MQGQVLLALKRIKGFLGQWIFLKCFLCLIRSQVVFLNTDYIYLWENRFLGSGIFIFLFFIIMKMVFLQLSGVRGH